MKYKSISLNNNKGYHYSLVKYSDEYKEYLDELNKMNVSLANYVLECPKLYSEASDNQSYMIFQGEYNCVGAIYINTSTDEKNLEIEVQFNEKRLKLNYEITEVLDQLIDSLKLYFYDKENIEIKLINNIDLSNFNCYKYEKKVYDKNLTTYICSNKIYNELIPKLIGEIKNSEKILIDLGYSWNQNIICEDMHYTFDKYLKEKIDNGNISLSELFYKVQDLLWTDIKSLRSDRNIRFSRTGNIGFSKYSNKLGGLNYKFNYNILRDGFYFKAYRYSNSNILEIDENIYSTNIKTQQLSILKSKDNMKRKIDYTSPIVDNSSVTIELLCGWYDDIERCYIDFRTHKNNGRVNGMYILRILPEEKHNRFSIRFISRRGYRYTDFSDEFADNEEELFNTVINGKLTFAIIDELIKKVIPIINYRAINNNKQTISNKNDNIVSNLVNEDKEAINLIKEIKTDIPLPHLKRNVQSFIKKNTKKEIKKKSKKRILK